MENDVWSHKQLLKVVSHAPIEVTRLDYILVTPDLDDKVISSGVLKEIRGAIKPSDHVPVFVNLKL